MAIAVVEVSHPEELRPPPSGRFYLLGLNSAARRGRSPAVPRHRHVPAEHADAM